MRSCIQAGKPPASTDEIVERFRRAFTARTRVCAFSHITTVTGLILPVKEICTLARERGVLREKSVTGMDGVATRAARDVHELVDAKIAFARGSRTDGISLIGQADVERFAVGVAEATVERDEP